MILGPFLPRCRHPREWRTIDDDGVVAYVCDVCGHRDVTYDPTS
jgi:hypothetical protein